MLLAAWHASAAPVAMPVTILAAEGVYGQTAAAIAGPQGAVTSVLTNPAQDPHDFEATASAARQAATAGIVILNGAGYDTWMDHLLAASPAPGRDVIDAAVLMHAPQGANPHLWYNPQTMPRVAQALTEALSRHDPAAAPLFRERLAAFMQSMAVLQTRIATLRTRLAGTSVAATEPVFGDMATALGLNMRDLRFQLATMNGTEPRPSDVAAMEADLRDRQVRALIYNTQVTNPATERLKSIASSAGIPLVGITETLPPGQTYVAWMLAQLEALSHALTPTQ
jgi:zinc/manganese transport system substrate-binding protein